MTAVRLEELPWPGEELVSRVATGVEKERFFNSGQQSSKDIRAAVGLIGRELQDYPRILDFGCGCGRIMLWMRDVAEKSELNGVDVDARAIEWDREHIPWARFTVSDHLPPLAFPDGYFDFVWCHSVFTHIPEDMQDQWLAELRRVTKPGGNLALTVHGERALEQFEKRSERVGGCTWVREALSTKGIAYIADDNFVGSSHADYYHSTFHAPWYVFSHWTKWLTLKAYVTRGALGFQDLILFERPPDGEMPAPIRPLTSAEAPAPAPSGPGASAASAGPAASESSAGPAGAVAEAPAKPAATPAPVPALDEARDLLGGPEVGSATRYGKAGLVARRAVLRLIRHYSAYQQRLSSAIVGAIDAVAERSHAADGATSERIDDLERRTALPGITVWESVTRIHGTMQQLGDRVNRLEKDVFEAMRGLEERLPHRSPGTSSRASTKKPNGQTDSAT